MGQFGKLRHKEAQKAQESAKAFELIRSALKQCNGNQSRAAKLLQLKSTTLNAKMKHYGINPVRSTTNIQPNS
jgi:DNA-binding NtrC family response regulator